MTKTRIEEVIRLLSKCDGTQGERKAVLISVRHLIAHLAGKSFLPSNPESRLPICFKCKKQFKNRLSMKDEILDLCVGCEKVVHKAPQKPLRKGQKRRIRTQNSADGIRANDSDHLNRIETHEARVAKDLERLDMPRKVRDLFDKIEAEKATNK